MLTKNQNCKSTAQRLLGAVDLAIDFATLGEYGLEPSPVAGPSRERRGRKTGWEALTTARRGGCREHRATRRDRMRLRDVAF